MADSNKTLIKTASTLLSSTTIPTNCDNNDDDNDNDRNQLLSQLRPPQRSNRIKRARSAIASTTATNTAATTSIRRNEDDTKEEDLKDVSVFFFKNYNNKQDADAIDPIRSRRRFRGIVWFVSIGFCLTILAAMYWKDKHRTFVRKRNNNPNNNNNNDTMVTVPWIQDDSEPNLYKATIEFCQQTQNDGNSHVYGYRLPSTNTNTSTCFPAGIVLRLQPGMRYALQVCNRAIDNDAVTNLHFHGLHIPNDTSEPVAPGQCNQFVLDIPETHMGGTFYFHSHAHPNSYEQVAGGAYSMLIVEEQANLLQHVMDHKQTSQIANWIQNERLLLVSSHVVNPSSQPTTSTNHDENNAQQQSTVLGNGIPGGMATFNIVANTWYRFRIAAVDPTGQRQTLKFPKGCEVHAVAFDGIWRRSIFDPSDRKHTRSLSSPPPPEFSLTGASRIDLAVKCPYNARQSSPIITWGDAPVATLLVEKNTNPNDNASPFLEHGAWQPGRPEYVQDLSTLNDREEDALYRFNVPALHNKAHGFGETNGMGSPLLEMPLHSLQEWTILQSQHHPFHLHVFPMQTFGCPGHLDGEFYDTIMTTTTFDANQETENCRVRFHIDVPGPIMMHCHSLRDTDSGKGMAVMKVVDATPGKHL
jgi:FtsP/CotA-like multicopper oxidase with cupredoxin domain